MFSFSTGLSYKLSKIIHIMILQMFKGLCTAFSLSFMQFTLSLYICCSELSASQDFPRTRVNLINQIFRASLPEESCHSFPLLSSPESTVIEEFLVSVVHVSLIS